MESEGIEARKISLAREVEDGVGGRKERERRRRGKAEDGWGGKLGEWKARKSKVVWVEDNERGRRGDWTRTVAEVEAGHLEVDMHAVEVVFVLQAVVLQRVGDVEG